MFSIVGKLEKVFVRNNISYESARITNAVKNHLSHIIYSYYSNACYHYKYLFNDLWYGMVWYGMVWYGMVWYGMVWYGMVWYGMVWYGMVW